MKLKDIIPNLSGLDELSYILIADNQDVNANMDAKIVPIPENPDADLNEPGFDYWISVFQAGEVFEAWSVLRNGKAPTSEEAIEAIVYYKAHDAFIPLEGT